MTSISDDDYCLLDRDITNAYMLILYMLGLSDDIIDTIQWLCLLSRNIQVYILTTNSTKTQLGEHCHPFRFPTQTEL